MNAPGSLFWLARHELRLSWREWTGMMTAGKPNRGRWLAIGFGLFAIFMHVIAFIMVGRYGDVGVEPDKTALVVVTGCALLSWSLMLSQAMELVTRAFYARADLDLILSSPASARKVFAVRIVSVSLSSALLAAGLAAPFINVLALLGNPLWLNAYGVVAAMGAAAAAVSVALTVALFRILGPKRTRLAAQIIAAVIGAAFVIGIQAIAIVSTNTLSRLAALHSEFLISITPELDSAFWWPARAIMGDVPALIRVLLISFGLLAASIIIYSMRFAEHATAAAGVSAGTVRHRPRSFRQATPAQMLRRKEWVLLKRDPWLVSQTLMQILYLLPPALLLWRNFGEDAGGLVVLVPIFVMAAGQLAGGIAWLAVSGEDAPDLVATAPVPTRSILRAKVEAVIGGILLVLSPLVLMLAYASMTNALISIIGITVAAGSATLIQLWFRTQAKRSYFRRRQTSSRLATFAEAFSSIAWAATAGLAATGTWMALFPAAAALSVLVGARAIRPR